MAFGRKATTRVSSPERIQGANALTASGVRIRRREADAIQRLAQPWQSRSFSYYNILGEIKYAAQFYSRGLAPLRLYPAMIDDKGDVVETNNPKAKAALDRIQDPGGGRTGLLSAYGRLMFLTGEALLFVSKNPETDLEQWEVLSSDEIRMMGGTYMRLRAPSLQAEDYREPTDDDYGPVEDREAVAYRLWQRHPQYSMLADATMQGVLDLCEELVLMTQAVRARARSRLAGSGILLIDDRVSPAPLAPVGDEDPLQDPFLATLINAMTAPITDEGSASAVVPLLLRIPASAERKMSDLVYHLQLVDPTQLYPETGLRRECIERIAIGLDMPVEILLGMQDSNHWTAWQIDEQTWKGHLQPKAQQLVDDLTSAYFRPALRDGGVTDWMKYCIGYDATAILNHPDRAKDAKDLYDKVAIGKRALRDATGFAEEDAPTEEERAEMLGVKIRDASLAWYGIPTVRGGNVETAPGEIVDSADPNQPGGPSTGAEVEPGPPSNDEPLPETVVGGGNGDHRRMVEVMNARVMGASDLAIQRAREVAGNRLKGLAKRDPDMLELILGVRVGQIAVVLGRERVKQLGAPSDNDLVQGTGELIKDAIRVFGIDEPSILDRVSENIEKHAARTLYDERPAPLPTSFSNYVTGLLVTQR